MTTEKREEETVGPKSEVQKWEKGIDKLTEKLRALQARSELGAEEQKNTPVIFPKFSASAIMTKESSEVDMETVNLIGKSLLEKMGISATQVEANLKVPQSFDLTGLPFVLTSPHYNDLYQFYSALARLRNLSTEAHEKGPAPLALHIVPEKGNAKKHGKRAQQIKIVLEHKSQVGVSEEKGKPIKFIEKTTPEDLRVNAIHSHLQTSVLDSLIEIGKYPFLKNFFITNKENRWIFLQLIHGCSLDASHGFFLQAIMEAFIKSLLQLKGTIPAVEFDLIEIIVKNLKDIIPFDTSCTHLPSQENSLRKASLVLQECFKDKTKSLTEILECIKPIEGLNELPLNLQHWLRDLMLNDCISTMLDNLPDAEDFRRYELILKKGAQCGYLPTCLDGGLEGDESQLPDRLLATLQGLYEYTTNIEFNYGYVPSDRSPYPHLNFHSCHRIKLLIILFTIFEKRPAEAIITRDVKLELLQKAKDIITNYHHLLMQTDEKRLRKVLLVASQLIITLEAKEATSVYGVTLNDCDELMHALLDGGSNFDPICDLLSYNQAFFADAEQQFTSLIKMLRLVQNLGLSQAQVTAQSQDKQPAKKEEGAKASQKVNSFEAFLKDHLPSLKTLEQDINALSRFRQHFPLTMQGILKILEKADLLQKSYFALHEGKQSHYAKKYLELQMALYQMAIQFGADSEALKRVELSLKLDMDAFHKHQIKQTGASNSALSQKKKHKLKAKSQSKKDKSEEKEEEKNEDQTPMIKDTEEADQTDETEALARKAPEPPTRHILRRQVVQPVLVEPPYIPKEPTRAMPRPLVSNHKTRTEQIPALSKPTSFLLPTPAVANVPKMNSLQEFPAMGRKPSSIASSSATILSSQAAKPKDKLTAATITSTTTETATASTIASTKTISPVTTTQSQSITTVSLFAPARIPTSTPTPTPVLTSNPILPVAPVPAVEIKMAPAENKSETADIAVSPATEHPLSKDKRRILDKALLPPVLLEFLKNAMPTLTVLLTGPAVYNYFRKEPKERILNNMIELWVCGVQDVQLFKEMLSTHQVTATIKLKQDTIPWIQLSLGPKNDRYTIKIFFGQRGESLNDTIKRLIGEADANLYALWVNLSEAWTKPCLYFEGNIERIMREVGTPIEQTRDDFFNLKPRRFTTITNAALMYKLSYSKQVRKLLKNKTQTYKILDDFLHNDSNALLNALDMASDFEQVLKYVDIRAVVSVYNSDGVVYAMTKLPPEPIDRTIALLPVFSQDNALSEVVLAKKNWAMIVAFWYEHYVAGLVYSNFRMTMHPRDFKQYLESAMQNAPFKNFMACVEYQMIFSYIKNKYLATIIDELVLELALQNTPIMHYMVVAGLEFDYQVHLNFIKNKYLEIFKSANRESADADTGAENLFNVMVDDVDDFYQMPYIEKMAENYLIRQGLQYPPQQPAQMPMPIPTGHYGNNNPSAFYAVASSASAPASAYTYTPASTIT